MFGAEDGNVGVIVELRQIGFPPPNRHGLAGANTDTYGRFERLRPTFNRTEGGLSPIKRPNALAHLTEIGKEIRLEFAHGCNHRIVPLVTVTRLALPLRVECDYPYFRASAVGEALITCFLV